MEYRTEWNVPSEPSVLAAEVPEIPRRMSTLFNDLHELRETTLYLSSKLETIMSPSAPTTNSPEKVCENPSTGLGAQIAEINMLVNDTRSILGGIIDRLEI